MTFDSMEALKTHILKLSEPALEKARDKVAEVIKGFLTQYYKEFEPDVYVRTYQLLNSLVKSDVEQTPDGWVAKVYFDVNELNYSMRIVPQGQPWSKYAKPENTFHRKDWTKENDEWVLETAMTGLSPHGGYEGSLKNTAIWTESMKVLSQNGIELLKQELIEAGIPVK